jgi:hypothetical protein
MFKEDETVDFDPVEEAFSVCDQLLSGPISECTIDIECDCCRIVQNVPHKMNDLRMFD